MNGFGMTGRHSWDYQFSDMPSVCGPPGCEGVHLVMGSNNVPSARERRSRRDALLRAKKAYGRADDGEGISETLRIQTYSTTGVH
jgi:hypothetical protein